MLKCKTIEQFKCYEFLKKNFYEEKLEKIELYDSTSILIEDMNHEQAIIRFEDGCITLKSIDFRVVALLGEEVICYLKADEDKVIENNDYITPIEIKSFLSEIEALQFLREFVESEGNYYDGD